MKTQFHIFGQPVELLVLSEQTGGTFSVGRQTCAPGTGTPPHMHMHEDEVFSTVAGRFEIFNGESWAEIPAGGIVFAPRGNVHCFRNCGHTDGIIQFICSGPRFDHFLEGLAAYHLPDDIQSIVNYSFTYGITYPTLPSPSTNIDRVTSPVTV